MGLWDGPVDEVELRLSPGENGETVLEIEHASVSATAPDGVSDAILGVGIGWEMALDYLGKFFRGELPHTPGRELTQQEFEPTPEDLELVNLRSQAWTAVVDAPDRAPSGERTS